MSFQRQHWGASDQVVLEQNNACNDGSNVRYVGFD
jgi:hypothetical protein